MTVLENDRTVERNFKLTIAYEGTHYGGWQIQPNARSIQQIIQEAIRTVIRQEVTVIGSGRTDAGVHAIGQVAHFKSCLDIELAGLLRSLNGVLPPDIRILQIEVVPLNFHAQRSAYQKTYHYHLHLDHVMDPFHRLTRWHVHSKCDLELLRKGAALFVGTHDFSSFANEAYKGSAAKNPIRTMHRLDVVTQPGGVLLELTANGFLYKMVRNIVGTLVEVASGKRPLDNIKELLSTKNGRCRAGQAAPPHGLFLVSVDYR